MTPLPGGFPTDKTVENAATVRVSKPGLDFLEKNLGNIAAIATSAPNGNFELSIPVIPFAVPDAFLAFDVNGTICPDGADPKSSPPRCVARAAIKDAKFQIDAITPNAIRIKATIPLKLDDTPVKITDPFGGTIHVGYGANATCDAEKPVVAPKDLPITITVPIVAETIAPRIGYSKVDVDGATIDLAELKSDDVRMCATCGVFPSAFCNAILNWGFLKDKIVGSIKGSLDTQLKSALKGYLCTAPNPTLVPACPLESSPDEAGTYCVYDSDKTKCVPTLLGTDAHVDLGGFLASVSPTTAGGLDFGVASFGPMKPLPAVAPNGSGRTPNGITLGMVGGVAPQPPSKCVPQAAVILPKGIPIPDELAPTQVEAAGTPHVGLALSGRFLEYAFTNVYNAGLLCLGVSTEQFDLLKSGILSILIPSIKTLTFEQADAAAAVATRPQKPPILKVGGGTDPKTDPLLTLTLPSLAIDIYIWSFDRFVRVFTYTADLTIPVTLQSGKSDKNPNAGIIPSIGEVVVTNGTLSNGDVLLLDDPDTVAQSVSAIIGSLSQQLVGAGLAPINLSGAVASLGLGLEIDKITKLTKGTDDFVGIFATMTNAPPTGTTDTKPKMIARTVDKAGLTGADRTRFPTLSLEMAASGTDQPVEYSWWIDQNTHSPWSRDEHVVIQSQQLLLQGKHVLHVSSRAVGHAESEDPTPAALDFTIDGLAPMAKIERVDGAARVKAWDLVSTKLTARYRLDDGAFSSWMPAEEVAVRAPGSLEIQVADEDGNVAMVHDEQKPATASGSGCTIAHERAPDAAFALVALVAALALRRRRGLLALVAALGCGSDDEAKTHCGSNCDQACLTGLKIGQPGAFLSVAKDHDGAVWAAGYNDSLIDGGNSMPFGDLVVGKYDLGKQSVEWQTVDGVPARTDGTCSAYAKSEWRSGETDGGDDVGRWTSIQIGAANQPLVTYYDDTHHRLKLAVFEDGVWKTTVLKEQAGADVGRYAKMALDGAKPVIAFLQLEPGTDGRMRSKVVLARSTTSTPHAGSDFQFEDIAVDDAKPCRPALCGEGTVCIKPTGQCMAATTGCARCADGEACVEQNVAPVCLAKTSDVEARPHGLGAGISLASGPKGLGVVTYDGDHGNLVALMDRGAVPWERVILDGETGSRADKTEIDTGNAGSASSLFIDPSGNWHVSYVDATSQTLRYLEVIGGKPSRPEIVDDGSSTDSRHVVGDDSQVRLTGDAVEIVYTDSTTLGIKRAVGRGTQRAWDAKPFPQTEVRWLAFPRFVPDSDLTLAWWRSSFASTRSVAGNVTSVKP